VPAFSGLDVGLRCPALQNIGAGQARHVRAKCRAGQGLTIGAMADPDLGWVDFSLKADLTAMAASGDFHRHFSLSIPRAIPGAVTVKFFRLGVSGNGRQPCDSPEAPDLLLDMMTNSAQYGRAAIKTRTVQSEWALHEHRAYLEISLNQSRPVHLSY